MLEYWNDEEVLHSTKLLQYSNIPVFHDSTMLVCLLAQLKHGSYSSSAANRPSDRGRTNRPDGLETCRILAAPHKIDTAIQT